MKYKKIGVMCGSSEVCPEKYLKMAQEVGELLAKLGHTVVYGGGAKGLMRRVADGALVNNGHVEGHIPEFMIAVEWQHPELTNLFISKDMADRKKQMMESSDATLFLPGGCGTMEEFFEWLSAKRLGLYTGPLLIYNFEGFYDPLIELLHKMQNERFHNPEHVEMWNVIENMQEFSHVLNNAKDWSSDAIHNASAR